MKKIIYILLTLLFNYVLLFGLVSNPKILVFEGVVSNEEVPLNGDFDVSVDVLCISKNENIWSEDVQSISFNNGSFSIVIGEENSLDTLFSSTCELIEGETSPFDFKINIDMIDEIKTLSLPVSSVPYSFKSQFSSIAISAITADNLSNPITNDEIAANASISYAKLNISKQDILNTLSDDGLSAQSTLADLVVEDLNQNFIKDDDNISLLTNDANYVTSVDLEGIKSIKTISESDGVIEILFSDDTRFSSSDLTGPQGEQGEQGPQGETGPAGTNGTDGNDGAAGVGIDADESSYDESNGVVTLTLTDGTSIQTSDLRGAAGSNGTDGQDGTDGADGAQGERGPQGEQGVQG